MSEETTAGSVDSHPVSATGGPVDRAPEPPDTTDGADDQTGEPAANANTGAGNETPAASKDDFQVEVDPDDEPVRSGDPDSRDASTAGSGAGEPAPDAQPVPAGEPRSRAWTLIRQVWAASPAGLLIGLLLALLGFALVVQLQSNPSGSLSSRRQDDLVRILDDLSSREERLQQQLGSLRTAHDRLTAGGSTSQAALDEARRRASDLGILAGTLAAKGAGIQMTIIDPRSMVTADDMLDTIEELRGAGAEAIQVGPARIGLSSAFTQDTPSSPIMVDGYQLSPPYLIIAIGDPQTLATAMNIPGGVVDTVRTRQATVTIIQQDQVEIRALRQVKPPQYAQPVPGPGN